MAGPHYRYIDRDDDGILDALDAADQADSPVTPIRPIPRSTPLSKKWHEDITAIMDACDEICE